MKDPQDVEFLEKIIVQSSAVGIMCNPYVPWASGLPLIITGSLNMIVVLTAVSRRRWEIGPAGGSRAEVLMFHERGEVVVDAGAVTP